MVAITQSEYFRPDSARSAVGPNISVAHPSSASEASAQTRDFTMLMLALLVTGALLAAGLVGVFGGRFVDERRGVPQAVQVSLGG